MLFFSLTYVVLFMFAFLLAYLDFWLSILRNVSAQSITLENAAQTVWQTLPGVLYFSILLTLSYSARKKTPFASAFFCILILASCFTIGISYGINQVQVIEPTFRSATSLNAEPGLILSRGDIDIVLLRESNEIDGPRLVSIPDQSLIYQERLLTPSYASLGLPLLPFGEELPWLFQSISLDFSGSAANLQYLFRENIIYFMIYVLSLVFFLSSLRFVLNMTKWPFANLFIGAVVFRLILSLESFLNAREINTLLSSILGGLLSPLLITPLIFTAMGGLIIIYTILVSLALYRRDRNY